MRSTYLPTSFSGKLEWFRNFRNKIGNYAAIFGIEQAEITSVINDHAVYEYFVTAVENQKRYLDSLIEMRNSLHDPQQGPLGPVPPFPVPGPLPSASIQTGILVRMNTLVHRIKHHPNYTEGIGTDLGIITPGSSFDTETARPVLKVKLHDGFPVLTYIRGKAKGIRLYVDRRDGKGFVPLLIVLKTRYVDTYPLPANIFTATWDYKARYITLDGEIGIESEIVTIKVKRS